MRKAPKLWRLRLHSCGTMPSGQPRPPWTPPNASRSSRQNSLRRFCTLFLHPYAIERTCNYPLAPTQAPSNEVQQTPRIKSCDSSIPGDVRLQYIYIHKGLYEGQMQHTNACACVHRKRQWTRHSSVPSGTGRPPLRLRKCLPVVCRQARQSSRPRGPPSPVDPFPCCTTPCFPASLCGDG